MFNAGFSTNARTTQSNVIVENIVVQGALFLGNSIYELHLWSKK